MGHKGRIYQRVLSESLTQDVRSRSLPSSLDLKKSGNVEITDADTDTNLSLLSVHHIRPQSPAYDVWFKTWPERYEKLKPNDSCLKTTALITNNVSGKVCDKPSSSEECDLNIQNGHGLKNKLTLNEALQNISLAYSPLTKQLHYIREEREVPEGKFPTEETTISKKGHRRNEIGSFSSTVSSLSEPSSSGSLLDAEECLSPTTLGEYGIKQKKNNLTSFFSRSVFSWKSGIAKNSVSWKLFNKPDDKVLPGSPLHDRYNVTASSSALIQNIRPSTLPAKTLEEEQRHREEYELMVAAAKRKEAQNSAARQKQQKLQLQQEEQLAVATKHFVAHVLPNWETARNNRKTKELWWRGLPSSVRGKVWRLAIGNDLNLTRQLYAICHSRAQTRLSSLSISRCEMDVNHESSMDVIRLDIARTFPGLCIFQQGGPCFDILHSLLAAYVCYRPDVGYVQGMSYIAAILILNMEQFDAFSCFANILNRPLHMAAFTLDQVQMQAYYNAYNEIFCRFLPKLYAHFDKAGLTPDLYLLEWIYTIYARAMPLDVACRIWDLFLRDGEDFIFRTALGILHLNRHLLIHMDFLQGAQFLTHFPDNLSADQLFKSIEAVSTTIGKQSFSQIVDRNRMS